MKKNLLSGLILLLPITITIMVFKFLVDLLTTPFLGHMESLVRFFGECCSVDLSHHSTVLIIASRIVILICLFLFVLLLGFLGKRLFFHWIVKITHEVVLKIPLINTIYRTCRDIILAVFSENKKLFNRVVIVPFPNAISNSMGLVSGNAPFEAQEKNPGKDSMDPGEELKSVFVPTSPHPISGFVLLVKEKNLRVVNISLEDAFKYLISCGTFVPGELPPLDEKQKGSEGSPLPSKE